MYRSFVFFLFFLFQEEKYPCQNLMSENLPSYLFDQNVTWQILFQKLTSTLFWRSKLKSLLTDSSAFALLVTYVFLKNIPLISICKKKL